MGDVICSLRILRRSPGFAVVAIVSLALGIGANTAIFSLVQTLILRTLPVERPEELVEMFSEYPGEPLCNCFGWEDYQNFRDNNRVFSGIATTSGLPPNGTLPVRRQGMQQELVHAGMAAGNFFGLLGVKAAIGRVFGPEDDLADAPLVAVISWTYWQRAYGGNPAAVGQTITVEDRVATIVGVVARGFTGVHSGFPREVWISQWPNPNAPMIIGSGPQMIARLKPGVTREHALAELIALRKPVLEQRAQKSGFDPNWRHVKTYLRSAKAGLGQVRDGFEVPLLVLLAMVSVLLLIACANVASLLLARGTAREREIAVRISVGASRGRIVRQVLTESLLLASAGALIGVALAYLGVGAILTIFEGGRFRFDVHVEPDWTMVAFTAGITVLTAVLFGLVPAFHAFRQNPAGSLRAGCKASQSRSHRIFGKTLVASQVALSMMLVSCAGLFGGYVYNLQRGGLGFTPDNVLLFQLDAPGTPPQLREFLPRLRAIPGVRSAAGAAWTPLSGEGASGPAVIEGYEFPASERRLIAHNWVTPGYFQTVRVALIAGRDFRDDESGPPVTIINATLARRYFAGRDPIGKHITVDRQKRTYEIIGVVGDAKNWELHEEEIGLTYFNALQVESRGRNYLLRTSGNPAAIISAIRALVKEQMGTVQVVNVKTLNAQIAASIVPERLIALLSGAFGVIGALLAAVGLYGLLAFTVARRTNEIGVRMALGATRRQVVWVVLRDALQMTAAGLLVAGPVVYTARGLAASLIADLPVNGVTPLAFGAATMLGIALAATWVPARRAARVDPMVALRQE